jgi:hypothetical protein
MRLLMRIHYRSWDKPAGISRSQLSLSSLLKVFFNNKRTYLNLYDCARLNKSTYQCNAKDVIWMNNWDDTINPIQSRLNFAWWPIDQLPIHVSLPQKIGQVLPSHFGFVLARNEFVQFTLCETKCFIPIWQQQKVSMYFYLFFMSIYIIYPPLLFFNTHSVKCNHHTYLTYLS